MDTKSSFQPTMQYGPMWDLRSIPDSVWISEANRRRAAKRDYSAAVVLKECPYCHEKFSARAFRKHGKRACPAYQAWLVELNGMVAANKRSPGRPPAMKQCDYCGQSFTATEFRKHTLRQCEEYMDLQREKLAV